jgi:abequosyltransferase
MVYLSICIPTYNRSSYLRDTIESIISQPEFTKTDEIEIVVSDNCSADNTEIVVNEFISKFPTKIKYNKNEKNILDWNYEKVLSMGSGAMLKLNNDTLILNPGSLNKILKVIKYCLENDLIPFLLNGEIKEYHENIICKDEISFISMVSYRCTWIGGFMISKKEFDNIEDFSSKASLMLTQVNVLLGLLKKGNCVVVIPDKFSNSITPAKKGGYNLPKIFLTNYFQILKPYFPGSNGIKVFNKERKKMLYKFVLPWLLNIYKESFEKTEKFAFDKSGYQQIVRQEFSYLTYLNFLGKLTVNNILSFVKVKSKIKHNEK